MSKDFERLLLTKSSNFLLKISVFHQISLVLNRLILALISCYLTRMRYMNLLMSGLKLETSFLICQNYLIRHVPRWYHLQTNLKWNIGHFTKLLVRFCEKKKITHSLQQTSFYMET